MSTDAGGWAKRPFNSPLECGFRMLFMLAAVAPERHDLQRLVNYDYLLIHSGDVENGLPSLHPAVPLRGTEWMVRRDGIAAGLDLMFARELIDKVFTSRGVLYGGNDLTRPFIRLLKRPYAAALMERAAWVVETFANMTDERLTAFMSENIGRWGAEFERLSALKDLEL